MAEHTRIVKNFLADLEESTLRMEPGERADRRHDVVVALKELLRERRELKRLTEPLPKTLGDLSDLPDELLEELSITKVGELESQIFTVINAAGKKADLDKILVGLYQRFGVLQKRRPLANKLWRMTQKEDGTIWASPDEKGTYQTTDPNKEVLKPQPIREVKPGLIPPPPPKQGFDLDDEIPF